MSYNNGTTFRFFKRKEKTVLTLWGWLIVVVIVAFSGGALFFAINPFLSINRPIQSKILVVEGWLPD